MLKVKGDSLAVLEYHTSGDFNNSDASGRTSYYSIATVPTAKLDGKRTVGGGSEGTFGDSLGAYNWEILFTPSQCSNRLDVMYNPITRLLEIQTWTMAIDVMQNPRLRYAIAESHIYYPWQWLDSLQHVVRKMLPNYQGVFCNAGMGETFYDYQSYTLSSSWVDANCEVVVFVQTDYSPYTVMRVAKAGLFPTYVFGDCTDDGVVDIGDVVFLLNYLYKGDDAPNPYGRGDLNRDCQIQIGDIVYALNYLYRNGDAPLKGCD